MSSERLKEKLYEYPTMKIDEKEIRKLVAYEEYGEYWNLINGLVTQNVLRPVVKSGGNGMSPTLYKRYYIVKPDMEMSIEYKAELREEIRLLRAPMNIEGYLNDVEKYEKHKCWLRPLNDFLKEGKDCLTTAVSINERSFEVFAKEKALKTDKSLGAVLDFNPEIRNWLNYYETPEPFFFYKVDNQEIGEACKGLESNTEDKMRNALIVENKDTWVTLVRLMRTRQIRLCGISLEVLIYGEGKKITRRKDTLKEFEESYLLEPHKYLYFGDLDFEGIQIYNTLRKSNPTLNIELMVDLYEKMIDKADIKGTDRLPEMKVAQKEQPLDEFLKNFDKNRSLKAKMILNERKYIPQEILTYRDFEEIAGE